MTPLSDPLGSHQFALELDGIEVAWFTGCSGLSSKHEVFEVEEGGLNDRVHRFVGPAKPTPIVLRSPSSVSKALFAWRDACLTLDSASNVSGAITVYEPDGRSVQRYELSRVWPMRWSGPELDGAGSELAVEELELVHEGIKLV